MNYWEQQTVLITGSSRGIGAEMARHFSKLGCKVAVNYARNEEQAKAVKAACHPEKTRTYKANVASEEAVTQMVGQIEKDFGPVTILVNNAGQTRDKLLLTMSAEDWREVMATHLDGAFFCTRAVLRNMSRNKQGRIVNVSSISGVRGTPGQCNYSAAKAGLIGFTRALAREMGKKNITCNAVALGVIETEMTEVLGAELLEKYRSSTSLNRLGRVEDVAHLVEYITGPHAGYLTGQVVVLDGGTV